MGTYRGEGAQRLRAARTLCEKRQRSLLFTGMGSSYYAPLTIRTRLAAAGVRADLAEAGELLHYALEPDTMDKVLVAVSQSGESTETRQVAEALAGQCPIVALTNEPTSALGRCGDVVQHEGLLRTAAREGARVNETTGGIAMRTGFSEKVAQGEAIEFVDLSAEGVDGLRWGCS